MSQPKPTKEQEEALKDVLEDEEVAEYVGLKGKVIKPSHILKTRLSFYKLRRKT